MQLEAVSRSRLIWMVPSRMARLYRSAVQAMLVTITVLALLTTAPPAAACSLDGIASLSVNGNVAALNTDRATSATLAYWASFRLLAAAPGDRLRFAENMANVSQSIPREALAQPFRWSFGDGSTVIGRTAEHRYTQTGWYRVTVQYYWPSRRAWVEFDRAEQHIVPTGDLFWTNAGYYAGKAFLAGLRLLVWLALVALILLMVADRIRPGVWKRLRHRIRS